MRIKLDKFSERARKTIELGQGEAAKLNHKYVGTEHILLGILATEDCGAAKVLRNLKVDVKKIDYELRMILQPNLPPAKAGAADVTSRARSVIDIARQEARDMNRSQVGTEHLLVGLIEEDEGVASQVLQYCGAKLEQVRVEILRLYNQ